MADKFEPPVCPVISSRKDVEFQTLETKFGDGYTQRSGAGLNSEVITFSATWPGLTIAEADQVEAFFRQQRGYRAFEWTLPRESEAQLYRCKTWSRTGVGGRHDTITATIERVYDL